MNPDIHLVISLQNLDARIVEFERDIAALPKHIAQIEKALDSHQRRLEADRAALAANQRDRKKLEGEVQVHEQKISKLRDQMLQAKTNEQYRAFHNEIAFAEQEIRKAEDRILDLMGESEPLEANVKKAEVALKTEKQDVDAEKTKAETRTAEDRAKLEQAKRERVEIVRQAEPSLYKLYEKLRKKWHGQVISEVVGGRCTGCNMLLRPQHFQDLRGNSEGVLTCEACGRIIYYNPPVDVEKELAGGQVS